MLPIVHNVHKIVHNVHKNVAQYSTPVSQRSICLARCAIPGLFYYCHIVPLSWHVVPFLVCFMMMTTSTIRRQRPQHCWQCLSKCWQCLPKCWQCPQSADNVPKNVDNVLTNVTQLATSQPGYCYAMLNTTFCIKSHVSLHMIDCPCFRMPICLFHVMVFVCAHYLHMLVQIMIIKVTYYCPLSFHLYSGVLYPCFLHRSLFKTC